MYVAKLGKMYLVNYLGSTEDCEVSAKIGRAEFFDESDIHSKSIDDLKAQGFKLYKILEVEED